MILFPWLARVFDRYDGRSNNLPPILKSNKSTSSSSSSSSISTSSSSSSSSSSSTSNSSSSRSNIQEIRARSVTYYQVLIDTRDIPHIRAQTGDFDRLHEILSYFFFFFFFSRGGHISWWSRTRSKSLRYSWPRLRCSWRCDTLHGKSCSNGRKSRWVSRLMNKKKKKRTEKFFLSDLQLDRSSNYDIRFSRSSYFSVYSTSFSSRVLNECLLNTNYLINS